MEEHARLARSWGVPDAVVPVNGSAIRLAPGHPKIISHEVAGRLVVDGDVIIPADGATMVARRRLLHNGYLAATLVLDKSGKLLSEPAILLQGVPVEEDRDDFVADCVKAAKAAAAKADPKHAEKYAEAVRVAIRRVAREWTGKKPVTDVQVVRV